MEIGTQADGTTQNEYFEHTAAIVHTRGHVGTDPYGKPARIYLHDGGMEAIAADMKYFLDRNLSEQLDLDLYLRHSPVQEFRNLVSRPAETMFPNPILISFILPHRLTRCSGSVPGSSRSRP